jgi:hypothetical protein
MPECKKCKGGGAMVMRDGKLMAQSAIPVPDQLKLKASEQIICDKCDGWGRTEDAPV